VYRFLLTRRWLGLIAAACAVAAACVALGFWQLDRYGQRQARNDLIEANLSAPPAAPGDLLGVDRALAPSAQWRRVEVSGRYDEGRQLLVRNRPLEGAIGYYVLTPLVTAGGPALLVNRGWVAPGETARTPPDVPPLSDEEVTVIARLRPSEPPAGGDEAPSGQVRRIDVPAIAATLPYDVYGGYGEAVAEDPAPAEAPTALPDPEPSSGPHLAYMLQWWVFAAIALGGVVVLARREAAESATEGPVRHKAAATR